MHGKTKIKDMHKYKEQLDPEKYVICYLSRKERSYLAQLVPLGILPILKTDRFESIKVEEPLCELCDARVVENEKRFLFKCMFNNSVRLSSYRKIKLTTN